MNARRGRSFAHPNKPIQADDLFEPCPEAPAPEEGGASTFPSAGHGPTRIASGRFSNARVCACGIIRDSRTFMNAWNSTFRGCRPLPRPPFVDFRNESVVAVFLGRMPQIGPTPFVSSIERKRNEYVIHVDSRPDPRTAPLPSAPFCFFRTPRIPVEAVVRFDIPGLENIPSKRLDGAEELAR